MSSFEHEKFLEVAFSFDTTSAVPGHQQQRVFNTSRQISNLQPNDALCVFHIISSESV